MTAVALALSVIAIVWCAALTVVVTTGRSAGRHRGAFRDGGER